MSEQRRIVVMETEQAEALRARIFSLMRWASILSLGALMLFLVTRGMSGTESSKYLIPAVAIFLLVVLVSTWLNRQRRTELAVSIYMAALTAALFVLMAFGNGVTGPIALMLILIPVVAQLIGGQHGVRWSIVVGAAFVAMTLLETQGVLRPQRMTGMALYGSTTVFFLATLVITVSIVSVFTRELQRALAMSLQHGQELIRATRSAQQAAQAAYEARELEEKTARQLHQAVQQFNAFLERVTAGDYAAELALDASVLEGQSVKDLASLERQINTTVATLAAALRDAQVAQQRQASEAWASYTTGFKYRNETIEPANDVWLATMSRAVQEKSAAASGQELALPVMLRGEVIGAIGARRGEQADWSAEDIALAQSVTDQLSQTIEGLRLLEETQRRAARERLAGEITARMRESLDVDRVLQTAVREFGKTPGVAEVKIRLTSDERPTVNDG